MSEDIENRAKLFGSRIPYPKNNSSVKTPKVTTFKGPTNKTPPGNNTPSTPVGVNDKGGPRRRRTR